MLSGNVYSSASTRPTGLCDVVGNSTSSSSEQVFSACGKVRRDELSVIWGCIDKIGGRVSFAV